MMKKITAYLTIVLSIAFASTFALAHEPTNLAVIKQGLIRYHDSKQYEKDINVVAEKAIFYLKSRLAHPPSFKDKKPAIVLDIDETSLSNYPSMVKLSFGGTLEHIREAEKEGKDPVIEPTLRLYQFAQAHQIAVIFITGRSDDERAVTEKNLKETGFTHWDKLILRSEADKKKSASVYKTEIRKKLTEDGYDILINMGDQKSDLVGGYADRTFKLPNPYYYIP